MARKNTHSPETLAATQDRRNEALRLRLSGVPQHQIAKDMGLSRSTISQYISTAIAGITRENATEYLEIELSRLDAMLAAIWPDIIKGAKGCEWKIDRALAIMDQRARLTGTYKAAEMKAIAAAKGGLSAETSSMVGQLFEGLAEIHRRYEAADDKDADERDDE